MSNSIIVSNKAKNILVASIYGLTLVILGLFSGPNGNVFMEWNQLSILDLVKVSAAVAVCFFLPGYCLLSVVYRNDRINSLLKILLSYIISVLITGCVGIILAYGHIPFFYSSLIMVSINGLFLFLYIFHLILTIRIKDISFLIHLQTFRVRSHSLIVFSGILALIVIWTYYLYNFEIIGDQWFHHGRSLLFITDSIGNLSKLGLDAQYPPFFSAMLATYFDLSGLPTVNAYVFIGFLNIVPAIGFFYFFREWAPRLQKNAALLATTLFVLGAGLGWVYIVYEFIVVNPSTELDALTILHYGGIKTFDIRIPSSFIGVGHPDITTPLILVGLPSGFVLLGLLRKEMIFRYRNLFTLGAVIVAGSLFHDEFYLFVLISCITPIIMGLNGRHVYYFLPLCVFAIEISLDVLAHSSYYTSREVGNVPLLALLIGSVGLMWVIYAKDIFSRLVRMAHKLYLPYRFSPNAKRYVGVFVVAIVVYLYAFTFVVWNQLPLRDIQLQTSDKGQRIVPWYLYPTRLGITGLLGLIYIGSYIFRKFEKWVWIFALIALVAFIAGPYYDENRFTKYIELAMACFASILVVEVISKIKHQAKPLIVSMMFGVLLLGSGLSILLYTSYSILALKNEGFSQFRDSLPRGGSFPSSTEISFLNYLHKNLINPSTDFVTAPYYDIVRTQGFGTKLEGFVDSSIIRFSQNPLILNSTTLGGLYSLLSFSNIKFLLLPFGDHVDRLTEPTQFILNHLPNIYEDNKFRVFAVPKVNPPSVNPEVGLVYQDAKSRSEKELDQYLPLSILALSNTKYNLYRNNDPSALQSKILFMPVGLVTPNFLEYAKRGGTLVLLDNFDKSKVFESSWSHSKKEKINFNKIENIDGTSISISGDVPVMHIKNANSSVISYYYKDSQRVAPFSLLANFGNGKIILTNSYPYFQSVIKSSNIYFSSLQELLNILGLKINSFANPENINIYPPPRFFGPMNIIGNAKISTESFSLKSPSDVHVDEINFVKGKDITNMIKNVTITNLTMSGKGEIMIESSKLTIPVASDFDYLTGMIPGSFNLQIKVGNLSNVVIVTNPNSSQLTLSGGTVLLKGIIINGHVNNKDVPIVLKRPRIEANGIIDFIGLYSPYPNDYSKGWASNEPVTIRGFVNLTLTHSDSYYPWVNSRSISYINWSKMSGTSNILSEPIRFPADISALAKQQNSQIPLNKAFFSEGNSKTIVLISVITVAYIWLLRPKSSAEVRK